MHFKHTSLGLALIALCGSIQAQQAPAAPETKKIDRVEVTGTMIKRTDKETPSVVQVITAEDIRKSGFGTVEEMLRSVGAVDGGSIDDSMGSGFVSGVSTVSLRGLGSQATLILVNGRRLAPVAAVDINFGRGAMVSVNTIPKDAIERVEILKDGASALYGSDAMAGVINYVLKKEYQGINGSATVGANDRGAGRTQRASMSGGFGELATQRFNVLGGFEVFHRDPVMDADLWDSGRGNPGLYNQWLNATGSLSRFQANSAASFPGNYYAVPASTSGSTIINGYSVANSSSSGKNYLGTLPGCPDAQTVGKGVPARPPGLPATDGSYPTGQCRNIGDNYAQEVAKQDRISAAVRGTYALSDELTAFADLSFASTRSSEIAVPYALTTSLVTTANPVATSWTKADGTLMRQNALILPVGHPNNPTNGQANSQPVQLLYRFGDLQSGTDSDLRAYRFSTGVEGAYAGWDLDAAAVINIQKNQTIDRDRVRSSLLNKLLVANPAAGSYRFGGQNSAAAKATVATDAVNNGTSKMYSIDARGSRELFKMSGGSAQIALGAEARHESTVAAPDDVFQSGDFIGLVANSASGYRRVYAGFSELSLPVLKSLELQAAVRGEHYTDFGNATTGKLGFKWAALPSTLVFRGTAATGFRAPSISQISNSFLQSYHSSQETRIYDPLRCDPTSWKSLASPAVLRDCNVLNYTAGIASSSQPGSLATSITGNPNLQPETSRSLNLGMIFSPTKNVDLSLDYWVFHRDNEIRVQRGIDIMYGYLNPATRAAYSPFVVRDPNPATWLPGKPNTGPILYLVRQYGNNEWTSTSGIDYDLAVRIPTQEIGKFKFSLSGTYTRRYEYQILKDTPATDALGSNLVTGGIPWMKGNATLRWSKGDWDAFTRFNFTSALSRSGYTATCETGGTAGDAILAANNWCGVSRKQSFDVGVSHSDGLIRGMTISANILNVGGDYGGTINVPSAFTYYYSDSGDVLGRRFNLSVDYKFK